MSPQQTVPSSYCQPVVSFLFRFHDKMTESTWHNYSSGFCLGSELLQWWKSARSWQPMRRPEATLKDRLLRCQLHRLLSCFPLFFLQDLATAARFLIICPVTACNAGSAFWCMLMCPDLRQDWRVGDVDTCCRIETGHVCAKVKDNICTDTCCVHCTQNLYVVILQSVQKL